MLKIATFNVNSINARLDNVKYWLEKNDPDILAMQELKCEEHKFPALEFKSLGYYSYVKGQKSYNGVAILSKKPLHDVIGGIPGFSCDQARFLQAIMNDGTILINLYVPNGNPPEKNPSGREKLEFKLDWLSALKTHVKKLIKEKKQLIITGDWNIIIEEKDVYNPQAFKDDALFLPEVRAKYREFEELGLVNIVKTKLQPASKEPLYSWWGYFHHGFDMNRGILIDHFLLTPEIANKVKNCGIDSAFRGREKPSDHTPVWIVL